MRWFFSSSKSSRRRELTPAVAQAAATAVMETMESRQLLSASGLSHGRIQAGHLARHGHDDAPAMHVDLSHKSGGGIHGKTRKTPTVTPTDTPTTPAPTGNDPTDHDATDDHGGATPSGKGADDGAGHDANDD